MIDAPTSRALFGDRVSRIERPLVYFTLPIVYMYTNLNSNFRLSTTYRRYILQVTSSMARTSFATEFLRRELLAALGARAPGRRGRPRARRQLLRESE